MCPLHLSAAQVSTWKAETKIWSHLFSQQSRRGIAKLRNRAVGTRHRREISGNPQMELHQHQNSASTKEPTHSQWRRFETFATAFLKNSTLGLQFFHNFFHRNQATKLFFVVDFFFFFGLYFIFFSFGFHDAMKLVVDE